MSMPPPMSPPGFGPPAYGPPGTMPPMGGPPMKPKTIKPVLAGIFLIIAGIDGLTFWLYIAALGAAFSGIPFVGGLGIIVAVCGGIFAVFGILALVGGVMALQRKRWSLGLIGSILGLFLGGWLILVALVPLASLFSLIGLILLVISKNEF